MFLLSTHPPPKTTLTLTHATPTVCRYEYLRPTSFPVSFVDLIRLLRVKQRGDKRQAKLLVLLLRVKNSMFRAARAEKKRKGVWVCVMQYKSMHVLHTVRSFVGESPAGIFVKGI